MYDTIVQCLINLTLAPLCMYLGGIGGTGKFQVIKAVSLFLKEQSESYRFLVLALTESAAALIDGSTYHSALGLGCYGNDDMQKTTLVKLAKV